MVAPAEDWVHRFHTGTVSARVRRSQSYSGAAPGRRLEGRRPARLVRHVWRRVRRLDPASSPALWSSSTGISPVLWKISWLSHPSTRCSDRDRP